MNEPRSVRWHWVDEPKHGDPDDCDHVLVERTHDAAAGMTSAVDRVILRCGNVDAEDMDRIAALPSLERSCRSLAAECERLGVAIDLAVEMLGEGLTPAARRMLAAARGGGEPDA